MKNWEFIASQGSEKSPTRAFHDWVRTRGTLLALA